MPEEEELVTDSAVPLFPSMAEMWGEEAANEETEDEEAPKEEIKKESTPDDLEFLKEVAASDRRSDEEPPKRRRGRPPGRGNRNPSMEAEGSRSTVSLPKNAKQLEKEISERGQYILLGASGLLGNVRPPIAMHPDEARAIAEPLAAYLRKRAEENENVRAAVENFVERWDLVALTIAVMAYVVRVWRDDIEYRKFLADQSGTNSRGAKASRRRGNAQTDGVSDGTGTDQQGPENPNVPSDQDAADGHGNYGAIRVPFVPGV